MRPTHYVLIACSVLLIIYDFYAALKWSTQETISYQMKILSQRWPVIPFGVGMLCGHFFWSQY
jgi:hypothetical protein